MSMSGQMPHHGPPGGPGQHPGGPGQPQMLQGGPGGPGPMHHQSPGGPPQQGPHPQGPHPQQQQHQHPHPQQEQPRLDNISKAKALIQPLKDSLSKLLIYAAQTLNANNIIDSSTSRASDLDCDVSRFDKSLEEFFSLCDQLEVHLKTSLECYNQGMASQRYLSTQVTSSKIEGLPSLSYIQYINVVKGQISFAKEIHDTLLDAAQKISTD